MGFLLYFFKCLSFLEINTKVFTDQMVACLELLQNNTGEDK